MAAVATMSLFLAPMAQAQTTPILTGVALPESAACAPGAGVTVVVNFSPTTEPVQGTVTRCAQGPQDSYKAALIEVGFTLETFAFSFGDVLCKIDTVGTEHEQCGDFTGELSWVNWINVQGGATSGRFTDPWQQAQTGIDSGKLAVDTYIGFSQTTGKEWPGAGPQTELPPANLTVEPPVYGPAEGSALAAAGWIGRQVEAGGGLLSGSVGFTTDAIYALAAAGVGGDVIDEAAQNIWASGPTYIGEADERETKSGAIAKTALALQIAGLDPTVFPDGAATRDLLGDLRAIQNDDGTFGSSDNPYPFAQALPILALARTVSGAPASSLTWLESQQCDQVGPEFGSFYGYYFEGDAPICESGDSDSTAMSVQALLAAGVPANDPSIVAARNWLITAQAANGGLGENSNSTGLTGQTFAALGDTNEAASAAGYIGGLQFSCDTVNLEPSAITAADVGAVAYDTAGFGDGIEFGIDDSNLGTIQYATVQAIFGLGTPDFGSITAAGAEAALPAVPDCTPPAATFGLGVSSGSAGDVIPFTGSGFSSAEQVTVTLNSTPIDLGSVTADADGNITGSFTVPAAAEVGDHSVVVAGVSSGLSASVAFTVRAAAVVEPVPAAAPAANADFTPAATKPGDLAATGVTSATMPLLTTSGVLLLLGAALLVSARNRRSENI